MKQREEGCIFDSLAINKMELLILNALGWRMRPVTPFPFLYFFLSFIQLKDPPMIHVLKCRASDIIFNATNGTSSMQYSCLYTSISLLFSLPGKIFKIQDVVCSHSFDCRNKAFRVQTIDTCCIRASFCILRAIPIAISFFQSFDFVL